MTFPFPCNPVIWQYPWKKTQLEKNKKTKQKQNKITTTKKTSEILSFPTTIHSAIVHAIIQWLLPFQIIILTQVLGQDIFDCNCDCQLLNIDLNSVWNRGIVKNRFSILLLRKFFTQIIVINQDHQVLKKKLIQGYFYIEPF